MSDVLNFPTLRPNSASFICTEEHSSDMAIQPGTANSWCLLSEFHVPSPETGHPNLRSHFQKMYNYLCSVAPPGRLPGRQHVDPLDFHDVLTFINLVDVERDGGFPRFRFRLVGTTQTIMANRDITGLHVEDAVLPDYSERILTNMKRVLATGKPLYDRFSMPHPERDFIDSERVYYPLASDGENVDMILILNSYYGVERLDPFDKRR